MIERLGRGWRPANASASSTTATVPEPSSSAPLQIESAPCARQPPLPRGPATPTWSMWALKTTYSFLSVGSLPSRIATTFGAELGPGQWLDREGRGGLRSCEIDAECRGGRLE